MSDDVECPCGDEWGKHSKDDIGYFCLEPDCKCENSEADMLRAEVTRLRSALAYLVRVDAFDPDTPPNEIYYEAWNGPVLGRYERQNTAEAEWDAHMRTVREACE